MKNIINYLKLHFWKYTLLLCGVLLMFGIVIPIIASQKSDDYYTNAETFYKECINQDYHTDFANQSIYYATRGKTAKSINRRRYGTIGWQITAEANGYSMSIYVKRGGDYLIEYKPKQDSTYTYNLYSISYENIAKLMKIKEPDTWEKISKGESVKFYMDAIMSIKKPGNKYTEGTIEKENGDGTIETKGSTHVYYMRDEEQRATMQNLFSSSDLSAFHGLEKSLDTPLLIIQYNVGAQGVEIRNETYKEDDNGNILKVSTKKNDQHGAYRFGSITLRDTGENGYNLYKQGYHLVFGSEWEKKENPGSYWASASKYFASTFEPQVAENDTTVTLVANWTPNTYYIEYNPNIPSGSEDSGQSPLSQTFTYDKADIIKNNMFSREHYEFIGWNTQADGSGKWYQLGVEDINLTDVNEETIVFYAQWKPNIYSITVDANGGNGGTEVFYQIYEKGFYADKEGVTPITGISLPNMSGSKLLGMSTSFYTFYDNVIDATTGNILKNTSYFKGDSIIHAHWDPIEYTITFDMQGGSDGTENVTVKYQEKLPNGLKAPVKEGLEFKGYYYNNDIQYYNEYMNSLLIYEHTENIILTAKWEDVTAPASSIIAPEGWNNDKNGIIVKAIGRDNGLGIQSMVLYRESPEGDVVVAQDLNVNGAKYKELSCVHTYESVYVYRLEVTDIAGNKSFSYKQVFYDITPPKGEVSEEETNLNDLSKVDIVIDVTDFVTGN